jgi:hypothetical protein
MLPSLSRLRRRSPVYFVYDAAVAPSSTSYMLLPSLFRLRRRTATTRLLGQIILNVTVRPLLSTSFRVFSKHSCRGHSAHTYTVVMRMQLVGFAYFRPLLSTICALTIPVASWFLTGCLAVVASPTPTFLTTGFAVFRCAWTLLAVFPRIRTAVPAFGAVPSAVTAVTAVAVASWGVPFGLKKAVDCLVNGLLYGGSSHISADGLLQFASYGADHSVVCVCICMYVCMYVCMRF